MPAIVRVPEAAVIEPAVIVREVDEVRPTAERVDVPVMALVLTIPATVSVPADAVIEPVVTLRDAAELSPKTEKVPFALASFSMMRSPPWIWTPPADTQSPPAEMFRPALDTVIPPITSRPPWST